MSDDSCLLIHSCLSEGNSEVVELCLSINSDYLCRSSLFKWACMMYSDIKFPPTVFLTLYPLLQQSLIILYYNYLSSSQLEISRANTVFNFILYIPTSLAQCVTKNNKYMFVELNFISHFKLSCIKMCFCFFFF